MELVTDDRKVPAGIPSLAKSEVRPTPRKKLPLVPLDLKAISREMEEARHSTRKTLTRITEEVPGPAQGTEDSFALNLTCLPFETPVRKTADVPRQRDVLSESSQTQRSARKYSRCLNMGNSLDEENNENSVRDDGKKIGIHLKSKTINNSRYVVLNVLGKGGSSEVLSAFCPLKKRLVAIKCVSVNHPGLLTTYVNEVKLLQKLQNCDRIIKMYDYEIKSSENKLFMVLEKGDEDLHTIIRNLKSHVPLHMLFFYWMEMLYAVRQIHHHGVIHSDLKPANFLQSGKGLKLIDFGIARGVQADMTSVLKLNAEGTCNYVSPEAVSPQDSSYKLHYKSDIWSLGCILYQLVYGKTPFEHLKNIQLKLACLVDPEHVISYPEVDWVPAKVIETIKNCLKYDIKSRSSVDELIKDFEHEFYHR